MDKKTGRLNLAYQGLDSVPEKYLTNVGVQIKELDLSNNHVQDYRFLRELKYIETLILDRNNIHSHTKFPEMPSLTTLWVNHNKIKNLVVFVEGLSKSFPNIKYLSMMNNEAAPSYFNGGSYMQYKDYRHYVISQLPDLVVLDDTAIDQEERSEAERIYRQHLPTPESIKRKRSITKSKRLTFRNLSDVNLPSLEELSHGFRVSESGYKGSHDKH